MRKALLLLAALPASMAWGQAPAYTSASIVNASDYTPGPFAPNSVLALFGNNLAWSAHALAASDILNNSLPSTMNGVSVYVDNWPAALLYVSPGQVNFIVPATQSPGTWAVRVVREGVTGPEVPVTLADAAPALFASEGTALATHMDGSLLTAASPGRAGELVVVYATGFGKTLPAVATGVLPFTAAPIAGIDTFKVYLGGTAVDPANIKYAGITPFSCGLYQINLELPANTGADPEIRAMAGAQESVAGLKLVVR